MCKTLQKQEPRYFIQQYIFPDIAVPCFLILKTFKSVSQSLVVAITFMISKEGSWQNNPLKEFVRVCFPEGAPLPPFTKFIQILLKNWMSTNVEKQTRGKKFLHGVRMKFGLRDFQIFWLLITSQLLCSYLFQAWKTRFTTIHYETDRPYIYKMKG